MDKLIISTTKVFIVLLSFFIGKNSLYKKENKKLRNQNENLCDIIDKKTKECETHLKKIESLQSLLNSKEAESIMIKREIKKQTSEFSRKLIS